MKPSVFFFQCWIFVIAQGCDLTGTWTDLELSVPTAQLIFRIDQIADQLTVTAVSTNAVWATGILTYNASCGSVVGALDDGEIIRGVVSDKECTVIFWEDVTTWSKVPAVENIHVVFMNHLDVGYNGIPETGFIANVVNTYFQEYFPRAVNIAKEMNIVNPNESFIYTSHPWLIRLYLECPPNLILSGIKVQCPSQDDVTRFEDAISRGQIVWHAGPMNMQVELMNEAVLQAGIQIAKQLDQQFQHQTTVLSQRDVPGLTACSIPFLLQNGIKGITVGVNPGSAPPAVPPIFQWNFNNKGIIALWHPGGYPLNPGDSVNNAGGLSLQSIVIPPGSTDALAFAFRTDNSGPPMSISEIESNYNILRTQFPGAKVFASTFSAFIDTVNISSLPVINGEIGDTWIQGVASDPRKMAEYRAISSALLTCVQDLQCDLNDPKLTNVTQFLIKLPEHTWGLPDVYDNINWSNYAFQNAKGGTSYVNCEMSWLEQRQFINLTLEAASGHPLYNYIVNNIMQLQPTVPSLVNYTQADPSQAFTLLNGTILLGFNADQGNINLLLVNSGQTKFTFASSDNPLALITYHTYNETDFDYMASNYDYYGNAGYDKPNSTANAHPITSITSTKLIQLYRSTLNDGNFIMQLTLQNPIYHTDYGAPEYFWLSLNISNDFSALVTMNFELLWTNKTPTRLAEATMFSFYPQRQYSNTFWIGTVQKISMFTSVAFSSVIKNGSHYQHAGEKVTLIESSPSLIVMELSSPDVPLICPIRKGKYPTPFPIPLDPFQDTDVTGVAFNLHNNIWNTNYPLWYPFTAGDENFKARFAISFRV